MINVNGRSLPMWHSEAIKHVRKLEEIEAAEKAAEKAAKKPAKRATKKKAETAMLKPEHVETAEI